MKKKLMAVLLAAGLGVTGIAGTAQAAEEGTQSKNGCAHSQILKFIDVEQKSNWGNPGHYVIYKITYTCPDCEMEEVEYENMLEPHDYEQIYFDNGKVMSYCTVCGDHFYW